MQKKYDRIYLIDCENIGFSFFSSPNDLVLYFTNNSVKELPFTCNENEIHMCLNHNGCKDALDFILDTYLGYLVRNYGRSTEYFIISNDRGYDNISAFWQGLGYKVYTNPHHNIVSSDLKKALNETNTKADDNIKNEAYNDVINNLSEEYNKKINNIVYSWVRSKKKDKSVLFYDLNRCLHNILSKKEIKILCEYHYKNNH